MVSVVPVCPVSGIYNHGDTTVDLHGVFVVAVRATGCGGVAGTTGPSVATVYNLRNQPHSPIQVSRCKINLPRPNLTHLYGIHDSNLTKKMTFFTKSYWPIWASRFEINWSARKIRLPWVSGHVLTYTLSNLWPHCRWCS